MNKVYSSKEVYNIIARSGGIFNFEIIKDIIKSDTFTKYLKRKKQLKPIVKRFKNQSGYLYRLPRNVVDKFWNNKRGTMLAVMRSFALIEYYKQTQSFMLTRSEREFFPFSTDFDIKACWENNKRVGVYLTCRIEEYKRIPVVVILDFNMSRKKLENVLFKYLLMECEVHIIGNPSIDYASYMRMILTQIEINYDNELDKIGDRGIQPFWIVRGQYRIFKFDRLKEFFPQEEMNEGKFSDFLDQRHR